MPDTVVSSFHVFSHLILTNTLQSIIISVFRLGEEISTREVQGHTKVRGEDTIRYLKSMFLYYFQWYKFSTMEFQRMEELCPE